MPRGSNPNSKKNLLKGNRFTKETASEAGKKGAAVSHEVNRKRRTMHEIAKIINDSRVSGPKAREQLRALGIKDEDMTNAALIVSAVFRSAFEGNMVAVDRWFQLVGETENQGQNGKLEELINGLKEPDDLHKEAASFDEEVAEEQPEPD